MNKNIAINQLVKGLRDIYGGLIVEIRLYGSEAKGTATEESDIDIAVLVKEGYTEEMKEDMLLLASNLGLECNKLLSVLVIDESVYREWVNVLPFYRNIRDEGVVLWEAA